MLHINQLFLMDIKRLVRGVQKNVDYNLFTHLVYIYNPISRENLHLQGMVEIYNLQLKMQWIYNFQNDKSKQFSAFKYVMQPLKSNFI